MFSGIILMKIISVVVTCSSKDIDDYFCVVRRCNAGKYCCVTKGPYALSWITNNTFPELDAWRLEYKDLESHGWKRQKSISKDIILDRRWEEFMTHRTENVSKYGSPLIFKTVAKNLMSDFIISFSVRTEKEAHIFLCDGKNVTTSNCYWFILMGFDGTRTLVRKCVNNTIPALEGHIDKNCTNNLLVKSETNPTVKYITNKIWNHFQLIKNKRKVSLRNVRGENIITFNDETPLEVKYMVIHSKRVPGLWKLHEIDYFRLETETSKVLEKPLILIDNAVCLSMFIRMCSKCTMRFELKHLDDTKEVLVPKQVTSKKTEVWREIKLNKGDISDPVQVEITTIVENSETTPYWEVSNIEQCKNEDSRMIVSKHQAACQTMGPEPKTLCLDRTPIPEKVLSLSATNVTNSSISLKWQPGNIEGAFEHYTITYKVVSYLACNDNHNTVVSYTKSINEMNTGITLTDLIPYATYNISVAVQINKFKGDPESIEINTLPSDTISAEETPTLLKVQNTVPRALTLKFSAINCAQLRGPLSFKISAIPVESWDKERSTFNNFSKRTYQLKNLTPFTNYTINITFCRQTFCKSINSKNFKTKAEPPGPVKNLHVYSKNEDSISLRWQAPDRPTGILKSYCLEVKNTNSSNEQDSKFTAPNQTCVLWPKFQCYTIKDLKKNVKYQISIQARNEFPDTLGQTQTRSTTTIIEPPGIVKDITTNWSINNDLKIGWKHPTEANGDIRYFKIFANSVSKIYNVSSEEYKPKYNYIIEGKHILPSTQYKITISAYNGYDGKNKSVNVLSPLAIPTFKTNPIFEVSNISIDIRTFEINEFRPQNSIILFLFIINKTTNNTSNERELQPLQNVFNVNISDWKLLYKCKNYKYSTNFSIGMSKYNTSSCKKFCDIELTPEMAYNITILLVNNEKNTNSYKLYSHQIILSKVSQNLTLLALLLLILLIPITVLIFKKRLLIIETFPTLSNYFVRGEVPEEENDLAINTSPIVTECTKVHSKPIKIAALEKYVKESLNNKELEKQHALFLRDLIEPCEYGALKENKSKNRYTNLIAYDHTRVVLTKLKGKPYSDYINANFIDSYKVPKAYIATQGPKLTTIYDFWRMIWQENVRYIVMLANIYEGTKKKVEKYWPDTNQTISFGGISISFMFCSVFAEFEHRIFHVANANETRTIHQYHFMSWPDHGVPLYCQCLIPFLQKIHSIPLSSTSPIVFHCSAGVGRTGTILLCDICLRMADESKTVDILRTLQLLRNQRPNMVDNVQQYKLAHLVILEFLFGKKTGIPCDKINHEVNKLINTRGVKKQMQYLEKTEWQDLAMNSVNTHNKEFVVVNEKNRFQDIVPDNRTNFYINRYPLNDNTSTYINAVKVDGFKSPENFIVTQQPMPNTVGDFWRLVQEKDVSVIFSLNDINPKDKTSCYFWPTKENAVLKPVDYITLKHASTLALSYHDLISIQMHVTGKKDYKIVEVVALKGWQSKTNCPKSLEAFLTFCEESQVIARQSKPIIVTCFDGAQASGLYISFTFIVEKMKLEQVCDVCQTVRTVRHNRKQFVQNEEQFEFLYRAAKAYIDGFQFYANFS